MFFNLRGHARVQLHDVLVIVEVQLTTIDILEVMVNDESTKLIERDPLGVNFNLHTSRLPIRTFLSTHRLGHVSPLQILTLGELSKKHEAVRAGLEFYPDGLLVCNCLRHCTSPLCLGIR